MLMPVSAIGQDYCEFKQCLIEIGNQEEIHSLYSKVDSMYSLDQGGFTYFAHQIVYARTDTYFTSFFNANEFSDEKVRISTCEWSHLGVDRVFIIDSMSIDKGDAKFHIKDASCNYYVGSKYILDIRLEKVNAGWLVKELNVKPGNDIEVIAADLDSSYNEATNDFFLQLIDRLKSRARFCSSESR